MNKLNMQIKINTSLKIIFVLMTLVAFFVLLSFDYNVAYFSYFNSLTLAVYNFYSILTLFLSMLYFTVDTIHTFDTKYMQIIRYKNYKEYFNKLIVKISMNNFLIFMAYIILLMLLFWFRFINIDISDYIYYQVPDILYFLFNIVKIYLIMNLIILFVILLMKYTKNIYSYLLLLSFCVEKILFQNTNEINTLKSIIWTPSQFLELNNFNSFKLELLSSGIYVIFLIMLFIVLKNVIKCGKKDIG